jgi:putative ABC transport system permease protein
MSAGRPGSRPLAVRIYGVLYRLLPGDTRHDHRVAEDTFFDLYREARQHAGRAAAFGLWCRSLWHLAACAFDRQAGHPPALESGGASRLAHLGGDARYGLRSMIARPGFSLTVILILALGIGATTTIFSIVDAVVLRQMPYPDAGRLVFFDNGSHSFPSFEAWRRLTSFDSVAAARDGHVDLVGDEAPRRLTSAAVSESFFRLMGGAPHTGRLFTADDYADPGSVAVLGFGAWQSRWGGDPAIVGQAIHLSGRPVVIVGVLSPSFEPPAILTGSRVDVWQPLDESLPEHRDHSYHVLGLVGRLGPATVEAAQSEVDAATAALAEANPPFYRDRDENIATVPLVALREATVRDVSETLTLLMAAVLLMLLIACANVANLMLARGTTRTREIALRKALGAGAGRVMGLVLTESVMLALAGGLLGVGLAYGGVELFGRWQPGGIPRVDRLAVDGRVLLFSVGLAVLTGVLFGALPAFQASRARVSDALKEGAVSTTTGRSGRRTRNVLVAVEVALALVLLVGAGLLFRTFLAMVEVDPGFEARQLTVADLSLDAGYDGAGRAQFVADLTRALEALPGNTQVAAGWAAPFRYTGGGRCCWRTRITSPLRPRDEDTRFLSIVHPITAGYFDVLRAPIAAGREFTDADMTSGVKVAILNQPAARELFGDDNPVSRTIGIGDLDFTVVGVVEGVHHWGLNEDVEAGVYVPYTPSGAGLSALNVLVRSELPADALGPAIRDAVRRINPALPVSSIASMEDTIGRSVATPRFLSGLFATFAGIALLLATAGIYGSMLYTVGQRRRELGIRVALGARSGEVMRMLVGHGLTIALAGIAMGTLAALAAARYLESLLWGVDPRDPLTFATVAAALTLAAVAACLLPAWRAGRTDPLETLRSQ